MTFPPAIESPIELSTGFRSISPRKSLAFWSPVPLIFLILTSSCGSDTLNKRSGKSDSQKSSEVKVLPLIGAAATALAATKFSVNIDVNDLVKNIEQKVSFSQNRQGFVQSLAEETFFAAGQHLNVVVYNMNQDYDRSLEEVSLYATVNYDGLKYGVWAFKSGTFTNKGDLGFINWCLIGNQDKVTGDGKRLVTFNPL